MSSQTLEFVVSLLKNLAKAKQPGLSLAADNALKLSSAAQNVKSNQEEYTQIAADACFLVFVVADQLRQKGQRNIDGNLKGNLDNIAGVYGELLDQAQSSTSQADAFSSFWDSGSDTLGTLKGKFEGSLKQFSFRSFAEVRSQADQRVNAIKPSAPPGNRTNNTQPNASVNQNNSGAAQAEKKPEPQLFENSKGFDINGGEFNSIGGDLNKTNYSAKNLSTNHGKLYGQNVGDGNTVNFNAFPE